MYLTSKFNFAKKKKIFLLTQQIHVWKWVITCKNELLPVNRQEILQKPKERYSKEKAAEY